MIWSQQVLNIQFQAMMMPRLTEGILLSHPELVGEGENNSNVAIKNPAADYFDRRLSFSRVDYFDWILSYLRHKVTWWTRWWGWGRARSRPWSGPESTWCSSSGSASNLDQVWQSLCLKLPSVIMVAFDTSHCLWKGVQRWASSKSWRGERWPGGCTCDGGSYLHSQPYLNFCHNYHTITILYNWKLSSLRMLCRAFSFI